MTAEQRYTLKKLKEAIDSVQTAQSMLPFVLNDAMGHTSGEHLQKAIHLIALESNTLKATFEEENES